MSRWTAAAELYLVDARSRPVAGPFACNAPIVAIVDRLYREHGKIYYYGSASRYQLAKEGLFPRTKAGDTALLVAVPHPDLPALLAPLLGQQRAVLGGGYDQADWVAIDALLSERGIGRPVELNPPQLTAHE